MLAWVNLWPVKAKGHGGVCSLLVLLLLLFKSYTGVWMCCVLLGLKLMKFYSERRTVGRDGGEGEGVVGYEPHAVRDLLL